LFASLGKEGLKALTVQQLIWAQRSIHCKQSVQVRTQRPHSLMPVFGLLKECHVRLGAPQPEKAVYRRMPQIQLNQQRSLVLDAAETESEIDGGQSLALCRNS